jgi:hypothetical protein
VRREVEDEPVGDTGAAVVTDEPEGLEAERLHDLDLVPRHRPLRVARVVCAAVGLRAVAVATQVCRDDREALGEARRHLVPHGVRLRVAVEKKHRRARPAPDEVDRRLAGIDPRFREPVEHAADDSPSA